MTGLGGTFQSVSGSTGISLFEPMDLLNTIAITISAPVINIQVA